MTAPDLDPSEAAAAWALRMASSNLSRDDLQRLKAWLAAHPSHRDELNHARKVWKGIAPLEGVARKTRNSPLRTRWVAAATALAAGIALFALAPSLVSHDVESPTGKVTRSNLADGSTVWLDTGAAIDFHAGAGERTLRVVRGRIHIAITPDPQRPFRVLALDAVIHDVGTAFTVDTDGGLRVAVTEGVIEVERSRSKLRVDAGSAAVFSPDERGQLAPYLAGAEAAWRNDRIALDQTPLEEALREADRYRPGAIILADSALRHRKVSGALSIEKLDDSLEALALNQHLRLIRLPFLLIVTSDDG